MIEEAVQRSRARIEDVTGDTLQRGARGKQMRRRVLAALAVLAAVVVGGPGGLDAQGKRWGKNYFPDAAVVTKTGRRCNSTTT